MPFNNNTTLSRRSEICNDTINDVESISECCFNIVLNEKKQTLFSLFMKTVFNKARCGLIIGGLCYSVCLKTFYIYLLTVCILLYSFSSLAEVCRQISKLHFVHLFIEVIYWYLNDAKMVMWCLGPTGATGAFLWDVCMFSLFLGSLWIVQLPPVAQTDACELKSIFWP